MNVFSPLQWETMERKKLNDRPHIKLINVGTNFKMRLFVSSATRDQEWRNTGKGCRAWKENMEKNKNESKGKRCIKKKERKKEGKKGKE